MTAERDYEYRRGHIEVLDSRSGLMQCRMCGTRWMANIRPMSNGRYYRGNWTCYNCGANSKGGFKA